jgi:hypothetical protein
MSKRKEPEGERALGAAGAPPPPARLGDHSSYMPEPLLPLADVRIKVKGGSTLPAHTMTLVLNCGALARSSELFVGASGERPAALSAPFDKYAEADVARFLKCIYAVAGAALLAKDAAQPAVVCASRTRSTRRRCSPPRGATWWCSRPRGLLKSPRPPSSPRCAAGRTSAPRARRPSSARCRRRWAPGRRRRSRRSRTSAPFALHTS